MERKSYQIQALLKKSFTLQSRQKWTNLCQLITPVLCLLLVYLIKQIAQVQLSDNLKRPTQLQITPRFMNPPLIPNKLQYDWIGVGYYDCLQWYLYDFQHPLSQQFIGKLTGELYLEPNQTTRSGLLGNIQNYYCKRHYRSTPFFAKTQSSINKDIFQALTVVNSKPKIHGNLQFTEQIPDGAVLFKIANNTVLKYKAQINDHRDKSYHRYNGITKVGLKRDTFLHLLTITDGMLTLMDKIHSALFNLIFEDTSIVSLMQYMPIKLNEKEELNRLLNLIGASLYPIALSLLLPVFMYSIVLEKEEKLQDFMKMNGMKIVSYWIVNFVFDLIIFVVTIVFFFVFGALVLKLQFFTESSPFVIFFLMLGWGIAQIGLAFFIQVFISKARTATIWGYLLSIWTVLFGITLNVAVYPLPQTLPPYLLLYPHFAMARGIYVLSYNCGYWRCVQSVNQASDQLNQCIACLWITGVFIIGLAIYLNQIVPRKFGVSKHPFFLCKKRKSQEEFIQLPNFAINQSFQIGHPLQDQAVNQLRTQIYETPFPYTHPLIVKDLTKIYKGKQGISDKLAVDKICLKIQVGECFGLLGSNGAGKTTLISMLTGLFKPNSGNAWISGYNIVSELDSVQLYMGVCPQFDILWPDLTVNQHLLFYARLKGIPSTHLKEKVKQAIDEVLLSNFSNLKSKQLSGGMKRRLSVAISLVGNPKIIFLDEPTTGLDPQNRRQLWEILARCREGKAIFLTSHSMEEADVLCTKIGILSKGILRCVGPQIILKSLYGGGYHLFLNVKREGRQYGILVDSVKEFVDKCLPRAVLASEFNGNLVYQVPEQSCRLSQVFRKFQQEKERIGIADWGVSQSSLEDVFLK